MKTDTKKKMDTAHPRVKVGASRQIAIPKHIYNELGLTPGDYLEMEVRNAKIVLTPKAFVEKGILEGLMDIKKGRVTGPFTSADDLVESLES